MVAKSGNAGVVKTIIRGIIVLGLFEGFIGGRELVVEFAPADEEPIAEEVAS